MEEGGGGIRGQKKDRMLVSNAFRAMEVFKPSSAQFFRDKQDTYLFRLKIVKLGKLKLNLDVKEGLN